MGKLSGEFREPNRKDKVTRCPSVSYARQLGLLVNTLGSHLNEKKGDRDLEREINNNGDIIFGCKNNMAILQWWRENKKCQQLPIGHLHDDVILLLRPESFRTLLSCANQGFCYRNLTGITKLKYERKNEKDSGRSSKMTSSCKWPMQGENERQ